MITTWYLHSHLTWDRLCQSCIGSSFLPRGAFLEGGAYAISRRLHHAPLEALRVARPEAVGLARTKRTSRGCRTTTNEGANIPTSWHWMMLAPAFRPSSRSIAANSGVCVDDQHHRDRGRPRCWPAQTRKTGSDTATLSGRDGPLASSWRPHSSLVEGRAMQRRILVPTLPAWERSSGRSAARLKSIREVIPDPFLTRRRRRPVARRSPPDCLHRQVAGHATNRSRADHSIVIP